MPGSASTLPHVFDWSVQPTSVALPLKYAPPPRQPLLNEIVQFVKVPAEARTPPPSIARLFEVIVQPSTVIALVV